MHFNRPIPRATLPRRNESSPLRVARDSDATPKQWQRGKADSAQLYKMGQAVEQLQRDINRLRRRGGDAEPVDGMKFLGEYNITLQYSAENVVTRGNLGAYVAMDSVPPGNPPEAGSPFWAALFNSVPGKWG